MGYIFFMGIILAMSIGASQKGCGIKCFSSSCLYNRGGKCARQGISVYDNTVKGLCLYHTENMKQRVLDPMQGKQMIEVGKVNEEAIGRIIQEEEEKLLKDPDAFAKWMRKAIRKKS